MAELIAKSAFSKALPLVIGTVTIREKSVEVMTSVAPFKGQQKAVSDAMKAKIGAVFPRAGRISKSRSAEVVWSGRGQAMVLGAEVAGLEGAALTDQSDAWACVTLEGAGVRDVLARIVPLDLRDDMFKTGAAARSLVGHMHAILWRDGAECYTLMVFRSMADTMMHDLERAARMVAARA